MLALSPAIYMEVVLPDGRKKKKRDTAKERACGDALCTQIHRSARLIPADYGAAMGKGKPDVKGTSGKVIDYKKNPGALPLECGCSCHLEGAG